MANIKFKLQFVVLKFLEILECAMVLWAEKNRAKDRNSP